MLRVFYIFYSSLSSRPLYVLSYNCLGSELNLASCISPMYPVGFVGGDCSHANDAGLSCGMYIIYRVAGIIIFGSQKLRILIFFLVKGVITNL